MLEVANTADEDETQELGADEPTAAETAGNVKTQNESTTTEEPSLDHATSVFGAIADNYRYDVFYETARQR